MIETIDWSAAENSGNPADSAGFIHNLAIWSIRNVSNVIDVYNGILDFSINRWGTSVDDDEFKEYFPSDFFEELLADTATQWTNSINSTSFSMNAKNALFDLIENFLLDAATLSTDFGYSEIKTRIVNWENDIIESGAINQSEKNI